MLSSRRLMLAIKFIDSPVDLGPCPQSPIGAPGGRTRLRLIIEETPQRAPGLGQEANLLIIRETQILAGVGQEACAAKPIFSST